MGISHASKDRDCQSSMHMYVALSILNDPVASNGQATTTSEEGAISRFARLSEGIRTAGPGQRDARIRTRPHFRYRESERIARRWMLSFPFHGFMLHVDDAQTARHRFSADGLEPILLVLVLHRKCRFPGASVVSNPSLGGRILDDGSPGLCDLHDCCGESLTMRARRYSSIDSSISIDVLRTLPGAMDTEGPPVSCTSFKIHSRPGAGGQDSNGGCIRARGEVPGASRWSSSTVP